MLHLLRNIRLGWKVLPGTSTLALLQMLIRDFCALKTTKMFVTEKETKNNKSVCSWQDFQASLR
jgi:hypothetical protein